MGKPSESTWADPRMQAFFERFRDWIDANADRVESAAQDWPVYLRLAVGPLLLFRRKLMKDLEHIIKQARWEDLAQAVHEEARHWQILDAAMQDPDRLASLVDRLGGAVIDRGAGDIWAALMPSPEPAAGEKDGPDA